MNEFEIAINNWHMSWVRKRIIYALPTEESDWDYYLDTLTVSDVLTLLAQYWPDKE